MIVRKMFKWKPISTRPKYSPIIRLEDNTLNDVIKDNTRGCVENRKILL
jgi:hypothetical protein